MQQVTAHHRGALRQRQRQPQAAAVAGGGGAGSSSWGGNKPQVQLPNGAYRPGPETPPLPVSAGVMRLLNIEGRWVSGQSWPVLYLRVTAVMLRMSCAALLICESNASSSH
jgi:hypothetical protein